MLSQEVNENRFYYYPWPEISSKVLRVKNITFAGQPRNNKYLSANISGLFYSKNYNQIDKRVDKGLIKFE